MTSSRRSGRYWTGITAPDWMDQKIFVGLSKSPWPYAENQHRLSNVRQTETGLTRLHAIAFYPADPARGGESVTESVGTLEREESIHQGPDRMDVGGGGRVQHHLGKGLMIMDQKQTDQDRTRTEPSPEVLC